jgi:hypothetical protein
MAETAESKPAFWSSLPGILTGFGGIIVALTGLITALYSTGMIGGNTNANANAVPPPESSARALASVSSPSPTPNNDRYKALAGKWRVVEVPPLDEYFDAVDRGLTWEYDAAVDGNVLTLKGKILFVENSSDKPNKDEQRIHATLETTLTGLSGEGDYDYTPINGPPRINSAKIRLNDNLKGFEGEIKNEANGKIHKLKGRKQ